jgi:hypothetical protein
MSEARQLSIFDPPAKEQKLTQCMKIVKYMNDFGSITPVQAMKDLGVMRLAARISDLEAEGWQIEHERETGENRYGEKTTYARYRLKQAVTA